MNTLTHIWSVNASPFVNVLRAFLIVQSPTISFVDFHLGGCGHCINQFYEHQIGKCDHWNASYKFLLGNVHGWKKKDEIILNFLFITKRMT